MFRPAPSAGPNDAEVVEVQPGFHPRHPTAESNDAFWLWLTLAVIASAVLLAAIVRRRRA